MTPPTGLSLVIPSGPGGASVSSFGPRPLAPQAAAAPCARPPAGPPSRQRWRQAVRHSPRHPWPSHPGQAGPRWSLSDRGRTRPSVAQPTGLSLVIPSGPGWASVSSFGPRPLAPQAAAAPGARPPAGAPVAPAVASGCSTQPATSLAIPSGPGRASVVPVGPRPHAPQRGAAYGPLPGHPIRARQGLGLLIRTEAARAPGSCRTRCAAARRAPVAPAPGCST